MGWSVCYHTGMSTTPNIDHPRCPICGNWEDASSNDSPCENCQDTADLAFEQATGYEADEDALLYWDQHAEG